ncbi:MAG: response regulator [Bdellovibrio sp.]|nr:response regulator [Bdellovibrio sp.]
MTAKISLKILVVEDESVVRENLVYILNAQGHELFAAENGRDAVEILAKNPEIDLIISDFNMPVMNGAKLNLWLQEQGPHCPFILCTGSPEMISRELFQKLKIYAMITKPYTVEEIEKHCNAIASAKINKTIMGLNNKVEC